ncbi:MAG: bifunctional transaldolase/phosoglucose isomerase [Candidatus Obscuribacterales bacterium]|nr:bifunctional transaldolase/phosoglucose isomerase [Candidatus Obscuribacterales bacterium]
MANGTDSGITHDAKIGAVTYSLGSYQKDMHLELNSLAANNFCKRLWQKDSSLWTNSDEGQWLGWLDIVTQQLKRLAEFNELTNTIARRGLKHAVLLGMGGSSLCVEVMRQTFGSAAGQPTMLVLDSVVPAQVQTVRSQIDPASTIFIVASKSGSTTEPNVLFQYFFDETKKVVGEKAGEHFIAITDPGSSMEKRAREAGFAHIFYGLPTIGGRFSALSDFGMIPAAIMGLDIKGILKHAESMQKACSPESASDKNPGMVLGSALGALTDAGRDKVTVIASPAIHSLGTWLEQLIAESTGKEERGIIPIAAETLCSPEEYGNDRLFVYVRLNNSPDATQDKMVQALEKAGQPVVRIEMNDTVELGAEFLRWEIATATAGAILGINAFNQPNVQESKDFTKEYLAAYNSSGSLPQNKLLLEESGLKLYADDENTARLEAGMGGNKSLVSALKAHFASIEADDYFAINAYIECCQTLDTELQILRDAVMRKNKVATTVGFGPRFLHSTGQLHKGGPNSGVFLQITSDDARDLAIPGEKFSFGVLKEAQSLGDFKALSTRQRRLLRVHLPADVNAGLKALQAAFKAALS